MMKKVSCCEMTQRIFLSCFWQAQPFKVFESCSQSMRTQAIKSDMHTTCRIPVNEVLMTRYYIRNTVSLSCQHTWNASHVWNLCESTSRKWALSSKMRRVAAWSPRSYGVCFAQLKQNMIRWLGWKVLLLMDQILRPLGQSVHQEYVFAVAPKWREWEKQVCVAFRYDKGSAEHWALFWAKRMLKVYICTIKSRGQIWWGTVFRWSEWRQHVWQAPQQWWFL